MELDNFDYDVSEAETEFPEKVEIDRPPPERNRMELRLHSGISNDDYHSGPGLSSSEVKYSNKAPSLFYAHVTGKVPRQETAAMRLGTAVHKLILEAVDFSKDVIVGPKFGRKAADREEKKVFYEKNKGKTILTADEYDQCRYMRDSLMNLPDVQYIMSAGESELSGFYIDPQTGMLCKFRPDRRRNDLHFDVKSTQDISKSKFSRTIHDFGYHISAAHYLEGDSILTGSTHKQFVFGAVESNPPYLAKVWILDQESLELGASLRRAALDSIKKGRDTDHWPEYGGGVAEEIGVPGWALNDHRLNKI